MTFDEHMEASSKACGDMAVAWLSYFHRGIDTDPDEAERLFSAAVEASIAFVRARDAMKNREVTP